VTNDVALSYDSQAVIRALRNLLQTKHYDRPFNPNLGSNMELMLFEPISAMTASSIESEIRNTVKNYETRVVLQEVKVVPREDQNAYEASLTFFLENATLPTTVTLLLERNR
jgi:phage baseplate assembly protein W